MILYNWLTGFLHKHSAVKARHARMLPERAPLACPLTVCGYWWGLACSGQASISANAAARTSARSCPGSCSSAAAAVAISMAGWA